MKEFFKNTNLFFNALFTALLLSIWAILCIDLMGMKQPVESKIIVFVLLTCTCVLFGLIIWSREIVQKIRES